MVENKGDQAIFRQLSASCLCGACRYSFSVKGSELPYQTYLCSCNISRRISGVLLTAYVAVPPGNASPDLHHLSAYRSSAILKRYFCSTCGTHMFLEYDQDGHFEVSAGSLLPDGESDGIVKYCGHMWIEDTKDGGMSIWMPKLNGAVCNRHARGAHDSEQLPLDWKSPEAQPGVKGNLHARCHCGGVQYQITRPDENSYKATSPLPDVLVPYHSGAPTENSQGLTWWISKDGQRYLAGHCACKSCRRASGFDLQQWAFVPLANIKTHNGSQMDDAALENVAKIYKSSPGVKRTFCKTCGANVFWQSDRRHTLVDVSVGLLDAESGARAEEWLEWATKRVSFGEEAHNMEIVASLKAGLSNWCNSG